MRAERKQKGAPSSASMSKGDFVATREILSALSTCINQVARLHGNDIASLNPHNLYVCTKLVNKKHCHKLLNQRSYSL